MGSPTVKSPTASSPPRSPATASPATVAPPTADCGAERPALLEQQQFLARLRLKPTASFFFGQGAGASGHAPYLVQAQYAVMQIKEALGVDCACVPAIVMPEATFQKLVQAIDPAATVEDRSIRGLHVNGVAFVPLGEGNEAALHVLMHEALHVMSRGFSRQAVMRGYRNLVEGITQYFTVQIALRSSQRGHREIQSTYPRYLSFVSGLALQVGSDVLRKAFLQGDLPLLGRTLDSRLGAGTFVRAATALQKDDFVSAMLAISPR